ncbi:MAG: hypothetical protein ABJ263_14815 [Tateyamaria sp.]
MAIAGGAVAQAMSLWGGDLARFMPPFPVMICAGVAGAGLAGLMLVDAFGHKGWHGALWSSLGWSIATLFGAVVGATLVAVEGPQSSLPDVMRALGFSASLGVIAITNSIVTSSAVAGDWLLSGLAMHYGARIESHLTI